MSKMMKRLTAPRSWPVTRKTNVFVTKPTPGPHAVEGGIPLTVVLRDMLDICDTSREARRIVGQRDVLVDGRVVRDEKVPVGLMDVVSLPRMGVEYRMMLNDKGKLHLERLEEGESAWKLCRVEDKTTVSKGRTQLNLHDGRNIIVDDDVYRTGDVLKLSMPGQEVLESYGLEEGNVVLIVSGSHAGEMAVIDEYIVTRRPTPNIVRFKDGRETVKGNVFVIGSKTPEVKLPEGSAI